MNQTNRYTATKETAQRLHDILADAVPIELPSIHEELMEFLAASIARLPSRRAVENDRVRRLRAKHGSAGEGSPNE